MQKRGLVLFFVVVVLMLVFVVVNVIAQEENFVSGDDSVEEDSFVNEEVDDVSATNVNNVNEEEQDNGDSSNFVAELDEEYRDVELETGAGITPDSSFYFVEDSILSKFRDDSENREKKVAEIREMIRAGKIDAARKSLERYNRYADEMEKEVNPEKRIEARRSAAVIRSALREIENEIPEGERVEFVDDVLDREEKIVTAVEIAGKIKELCEQLSELDPLEYSRVCGIDGDSPDWQKKLDKKLTAEQREEAEKFGEIMSECFRTAGQECRCNEIPFTDFAAACSIAAPLATACEIEGNEDACREMDNLKMPELPEHLQDIMDELENDVGEDKFDLHMPKECQEAGATDKDGCFKVMFRLNAPEECIEAFDRGEISVGNEREAREKCEEIMFKQNAPEECIEAGLTGENRNDPKKCEEMMGGLRGKEGESERGGFGGNCREIKDTDERLKCYDGATQGVRDFDDRYKETKEREKQCAESCLSKGEAWDFSNGECSCRAGNEGQYNFDQRREERFREGEFREGEFRDREEFRPPEGFSPPEGSQEGFEERREEFSSGSGTGDGGGDGISSTSGSSGSGESESSGSGSETSAGSSDSSGSSSEGSGGGGITGGVIQIDNRFFDYFFKR